MFVSCLIPRKGTSNGLATLLCCKVQGKLPFLFQQAPSSSIGQWSFVHLVPCKLASFGGLTKLVYPVARRFQVLHTYGFVRVAHPGAISQHLLVPCPPSPDQHVSAPCLTWLFVSPGQGKNGDRSRRSGLEPCRAAGYTTAAPVRQVDLDLQEP